MKESEEMPWNEFIELLGNTKFEYKLTPMGFWSVYIDGKLALSFSEALTPLDLVKSNVSILKNESIGYFIKRGFQTKQKPKEMQWKDFNQLLCRPNFDFRLSPLGIWSAFLDNQFVFYFSHEITPSDLINNDIVFVDCPKFGHYLKRRHSTNRKSIQEIFVGLPESIIRKVLWVERDYRVHEWSFIPGGYDIVVVYKSGEVLAYDWVKEPIKYVGKILTGIEQIDFNAFKEYDTKMKIELFETHVKCIYSRKIEMDEFGSYIISTYIKEWDFENEPYANFNWK